MIRLLPALVLALLCVPGCSESSASGREPRDIAGDFVQAVNDKNEAGFLGLLTDKARQGMEGGGGFSLQSVTLTDVTIGDAETTGNTARVPVKATKDGEPTELGLAMKQTPQGWRISGLSAEVNGHTFDMDFEAMAAIAETMAESMAEGIAEGMKNAIEEQMAENQRREKEAARRQFDDLLPVDAEQVAARWSVTEDLRGQTIGDALAALAKSLEVSLDTSEVAGEINAQVGTDLRGLSRVEAIERLAAAVGGHAVFPSLPWDDSPLQLVVAAGERPLPVAFAGPFVVTLDSLEENPPHTTGSLGLGIRAYGFDETLLSLINDLGETLRVDGAEAGDGTSLLAEENIRYFGGGNVRGRHYETQSSIDLEGLLQGVPAVARFHGSYRLLLPLAVETASFDRIEKGTSITVGDFQMEIAQASGGNVAINVRGDREQLEKIKVRAQGKNAAGEVIASSYQSTGVWGKDLARVDLNFSESPVSLELKVITDTEIRELPFEFRDLALPRHREQPTALAALEFTGKEPVSVTFERFIDKNPDFPKVSLAIRNRANKAVASIQCRFFYIGASGKSEKDFPHSLTGTFGPEGHAPVVEVGGTATNETTAFFMPPRTETVSVVVDSVEFLDGSEWKRQD